MCHCTWQPNPEAEVDPAWCVIRYAWFATEMNEISPEKKRTCKFHSTWYETFPFLTGSHFTKQHSVCKLCQDNFAAKHKGKTALPNTMQTTQTSVETISVWLEVILLSYPFIHSTWYVLYGYTGVVTFRAGHLQIQQEICLFFTTLSWQVWYIYSQLWWENVIIIKAYIWSAFYKMILIFGTIVFEFDYFKEKKMKAQAFILNFISCSVEREHNLDL